MLSSITLAIAFGAALIIIAIKDTREIRALKKDNMALSDLVDLYEPLRIKAVLKKDNGKEPSVLTEPASSEKKRKPTSKKKRGNS